MSSFCWTNRPDSLVSPSYRHQCSVLALLVKWRWKSWENKKEGENLTITKFFTNSFPLIITCKNKLFILKKPLKLRSLLLSLHFETTYLNPWIIYFKKYHLLYSSFLLSFWSFFLLIMFFIWNRFLTDNLDRYNNILLAFYSNNS